MDIQQAAKGVSINLTAAGPSAMISIFFLTVAAVGIWGGPAGERALNILSATGGFLIGGLTMSGVFRER